MRQRPWHPLDAIVDRPRREAALALAGAWGAFLVGTGVGEDVEVAGFALAAAVGGVLVFLGFAAASRCRRMPEHGPHQRVRLALLSLAAGVALGLANLAGNWVIADADPRLRALLVERMARLGPMEAVVAAPLIEEVAVRLFLMSALAWAVSRVTERPGLVFGIALVGSAVAFASLHLARPFPDSPDLASYYRNALLVKYTLTAMPLGWVFWRWGLPYSILCHAVVNAVHLVVQPRVF